MALLASKGRVAHVRKSAHGRQRTFWLALTVVLSILLNACAAPAAQPGAAPAATDTPAASAAITTTAAAATGDTIKVGVLHSLSGTMSISEVSVRDATLLAIKE